MGYSDAVDVCFFHPLHN